VDFLPVFSGTEPIKTLFCIVGTNLEFQGEGGVYRALGNRIFRQVTVFGVFICPLFIAAVFLAGCELINRSGFIGAIHQEVSFLLIMDNTAGLRINSSSIANAVAQDIKIVMEKEAYFPADGKKIVNGDPAKKDAFIEINRLSKKQPDLELIVFQDNFGDKSVGFKLLGNRPAVFPADPAELIVQPDSQPGAGASQMILLTDMGKEQITHLVIMIKAYKQFAVSKRYVPRHVGPPFFIRKRESYSLDS